MYAIGGSAHPTIFSQGNYFNASTAKQVRKELKLRKIYFDIPCANIHQERRWQMSDVIRKEMCVLDGGWELRSDQKSKL